MILIVKKNSLNNIPNCVRVAGFRTSLANPECHAIAEQHSICGSTCGIAKAWHLYPPIHPMHPFYYHLSHIFAYRKVVSFHMCVHMCVLQYMYQYAQGCGLS